MLRGRPGRSGIGLRRVELSLFNGLSGGNEETMRGKLDVVAALDRVKRQGLTDLSTGGFKLVDI